ncbi:efflux RND transporter periplasmic adaptor subunit [Patescibacteria group bacterium]|nr:efflux RND transporter periplasmic adaptor subunit [Patescibacteria group bacterium]
MTNKKLANKNKPQPKTEKERFTKTLKGLSDTRKRLVDPVALLLKKDPSKSRKERFINIIKSLLSNRKRVVVSLVLLSIVGFAGWKILGNKQQEPQYQMAEVEKGTLVVSISASGTISSANSIDVTTKAGGTVTQVYVEDGETVTKDQKLAEIDLDDEAKERQAASWVSYLNALEGVKTAEAEKVTADIGMWEERQAIFDAIDDIDYKNNHSTNPDTGEEYTDSEKMIIDKTLEEAQKTFAALELKYKNADADIAYAKTKVASTLSSYQQLSSTITAPASGKLTNFSLSPGVYIQSSSTTSSETGAVTISSQKIGVIKSPEGRLQATINLSEIDVIKVKPGQKATLTLDAYPDKTFTGSVLSVDTRGKVSSGVTMYTIIILLDSTTIDIYPNMAVNANIILDSKSDILLVPANAVQSRNGQATVRVRQNGQVEEIVVEIGLSSDTQTEIISGISEGDEIITNIITPTVPSNGSQTTGTSPFGGAGTSGMMRMVR